MVRSVNKKAVKRKQVVKKLVDWYIYRHEKTLKLKDGEIFCMIEKVCKEENFHEKITPHGIRTAATRRQKKLLQQKEKQAPNESIGVSDTSLETSDQSPEGKTRGGSNVISPSSTDEHHGLASSANDESLDDKYDGSVGDCVDDDDIGDNGATFDCDDDHLYKQEELDTAQKIPPHLRERFLKCCSDDRRINSLSPEEVEQLSMDKDTVFIEIINAALGKVKL